jgi:hypothetical protein
LRCSGPELAAKLVEEALDGGERQSRAGRGGASRGRRGAALLNRGEERPAGSAVRSCGGLPESSSATTDGGAESSKGKRRRNFGRRRSESVGGDEEPSHPYMGEKVVG